MRMMHAFAAGVLAVAAPATAQRTGSIYPIQLYSYGFAPNPIVLRAGEPVTLVLTNVAGTMHDLKAPIFFRASRIIAGHVDEEGMVDVMPHRSVSITLIPMRGTYEVHCSHFFHTQLGMHTLIYVQ